MNNSLAKVVSAVAPALGNIINLGLPGSGLVISALAGLFGANPEDPSDIAAKIIADPEASLKLLDYQNKHIEELERIAAGDRSSAREREKNIVQSTGKRDWVVNFIAIFLIVSFFLLIMVVAFTKLDQSDHDVLYLLTGQLSGAFYLVCSYYFGSSVPIKESHKPEVVLPEPAQTKTG